MTTYPQAVVPVFAAGSAATPALMDGWVQQPFQFLTASVVFRGEQQVLGGQSLAAGANPLSMDTVLEDPYSGWSQTATGSQPAFSYLVPYTGWYEVTVSGMTLAANLWVAAGCALSGAAPVYGANLQAYSGIPGGACSSLMVGAVAGVDYLQGILNVSATVACDTTTAGRYPGIEIAYLGGS